jgi:hypothetical protein
MNRPLMCCVLTAMMLAVALPVIAGEDDQPLSLEDAITKGQPLFSLRYRYEDVDQANIDKKAHASTLRTTVGYRSGAFKGFSFLVEAEDVTVVGDAQAYNNKGFEHLWNGVTDRPVVADPALTDINQAYFQWKNAANKAHVGRREIIIGDARFVGNVGWRQNHQSFDAFAWTNSSLDFADLSYRFVNKVNIITGGVHDMASHLINADLKIGDVGTLGLYGYLLDYTRPNLFPGTNPYKMSTATYGAEFKGKLGSTDNLDLLYELEYAAQSDYGDNPQNIEASYYHLMIGVATKPVTLKLGLEVLGGDVVNPNDPNDVHKGSFVTPLATLHKFNGWADKFLATPLAGLSDLHFKAGGMIGPVKGLAAYHVFTTDDGGADLGTEFDIQFTYKTSWKQSFGLKGAFYSTDAAEPILNTPHSVDTNKIWVWTGFKI